MSVVVGRVGITMVIVIKAGSREVEDDVVVTTDSGVGFVISIEVAGMVTAPPVVDVATSPRTVDAKALFVHSTTTPAVDFIGMAKHSEPVSHMLITKFPSWLHVAMLPERQAMLPAVHVDEKLSVEKKVL